MYAFGCGLGLCYATYGCGLNLGCINYGCGMGCINYGCGLGLGLARWCQALLFLYQNMVIRLLLVVNNKVIEIAAKEKNDLLFYNVFNYDTNEDILYYLLFMMEQFNLSPLLVKLSICGEMQTQDPLILLCFPRQR